VVRPQKPEKDAMHRTADTSPADVSRRGHRPRTRLARVLAGAVAVITAATGAVALGAGTAHADPSPNAWLQLRICESSNRYDIDTGNGYYGAYQFSLSTWASVGGTGKPSDATPAEQDYRALMLYRKRGWSPWTCAVMIGLTEDADARSGVMPPQPASFDVPYDFLTAGGTSGSPALAAPAWPGRQYAEGDYAEDVAAWQKQAAALGYEIIGTGYVGPSTVAAIREIQAKAGLDVTGDLGVKTWEAAWQLAPGSSATGGTDPDVVYRPQTKAQCGVGATTAPAAPAKPISYGQTTLPMQCFQWQAASRGAPLSGTAYFGPATLAVVTAIQTQNGITGETDSSGRPAVGPRTWTAAWEGKATF
jgi:peptidoglycan hydrolase-like protein with peptidoglycan-binding domain